MNERLAPATDASVLPANLGLDLVRATEAAALAAGRWAGRGVSEVPDVEATHAMFDVLNTVNINGVIVAGESERLGRSATQVTGQTVGFGHGPAVDVVLDPLDGRHLVAQGYSGAISVAAVAPRGSIWHPAPAAYMDKIVVNAAVAPSLVAECMGAPAAWTLALVARVKGKEIGDLQVFVLDRPRHDELVREIRAAGARVLLRTAGDIAGALLAAMPDGPVDLLMGVGGVSEGLIAACAVRALGGAMLGRLAPQSQEERVAVAAADLDLRRIFTADELVTSQHVYFAATGVTDGPLLSGVQYHGLRANSNSLILRGETRTRRRVYAEHLTPW